MICIILKEKVLGVQVRHFVTWLRFAKMASFQGLFAHRTAH